MTVTIGATVRQTKGRPDNVGRIGTVLAASDPNTPGSAGDILLTIDFDGVLAHVYDRQVKVMR